MTVSGDAPWTKKQRLAIKDFRKLRKSRIITGLKRTPPPHLHPRTHDEDGGLVAPPLLENISIYVGNVYAPTQVHDQLNDHPTPMKGSLAPTSAACEAFNALSPRRPCISHGSSYRTLLYAINFCVVSKYKGSPDHVKIHVPHQSILNCLERLTTTKPRHLTQLTLLRLIHTQARPNMTFHSPSRLAQYRSSWTLDRWGGNWVGYWRTKHAGAAPGHVKEETLQTLLAADAQDPKWLPFSRISWI